MECIFSPKFQVNDMMLLLMEEILHQLIGSLSVYHIIYRVVYIPGGCLGFLPSTVAFYVAEIRREAPDKWEPVAVSSGSSMPFLNALDPSSGVDGSVSPLEIYRKLNSPPSGHC